MSRASDREPSLPPRCHLLEQARFSESPRLLPLALWRPVDTDNRFFDHAPRSA
ncbi:hypothetical protein [Streptomyces sp. NPDC001020]